MAASCDAGAARSPRIVYQQGDHVCSLYTTKEEQLQAALEYIQGGLRRGERCLYVCCEHTVDEFREGLKRGGVDVEKEEARGALVLLTKDDGHLKGGSFDPERMTAMLEAAIQDALDAGFAGLCAAGDMKWLIDQAPGSERLAEYESALNRFYQTHRALGLCQYNRNDIPAHWLDDCMATHAVVRIDNSLLLENPFYELPELAKSRKADPESVPRKIAIIHSGYAAD